MGSAQQNGEGKPWLSGWKTGKKTSGHWQILLQLWKGEAQESNPGGLFLKPGPFSGRASVDLTPDGAPHTGFDN